MEDIVIFGAGKLGRQAYEALHEHRRIVAFCDNDKAKQNIYMGVKVYSFETLKEMFQGKAAIIIASGSFQDIAKQVIGFFDLEGIFDGNKQKVVTFEQACSQKSYSQCGEDLFIRDTILGEKEDVGKGFFVDIGAYHSIKFSNTYGVYQLEWRGINIEPNPEVKGLFAYYRKEDINVCCGISNTEKRTLEYYMYEEPAYNGFRRETYLKEVEEGQIKFIRKISVPVYSLKEILDCYHVKEIDFMSIDVEATELEVLQSNDWDKYRPTWLLIEQMEECRDIMGSEVYRYLEAMGYEFRTKINITSVYRIKTKR